MHIRLWGTRGSIPTITNETVKYGGNTPCVTVTSGETLLVLDAGSGARIMSEQKFYENFKDIHILLTHLHMDHIQGLGFLSPFYQPGLTVHMWGPSGSTSLIKRLNKYLSPPLFPVRVRDFPSDLQIHEAPMKPFEIGPFKIKATYICHPGPTFGYRVSNGQNTLSYIPDHEPALADKHFPGDPEWTSGYVLAKDADLLIHDGQFSDQEYAGRRGWGHSSFTHALDFAELTRARKLVLFHHDPSHSDAELERIFAESNCDDRDFPVFLAQEGMVFDL